jgi:hypothetical protein
VGSQDRAILRPRFQEYFQGCECRPISLDTVAIIHADPSLAAGEGMYEGLQGQVLGLPEVTLWSNEANFFTRGLGIWAGFDQQRNPEPKPKPEVTLWSVAPPPMTSLPEWDSLYIPQKKQKNQKNRGFGADLIPSP